MPGDWEEGECIVGGAYADGNLVAGVANIGPGICRTEFTISGMDTSDVECKRVVNKPNVCFIQHYCI